MAITGTGRQGFWGAGFELLASRARNPAVSESCQSVRSPMTGVAPGEGDCLGLKSLPADSGQGVSMG